MKPEREDEAAIRLGWKTRLGLFVYTYLIGPLTDAIVALFQFIFVTVDKLLGRESEPVDSVTELREARAIRLDANAVPPALQTLVPLATYWGIGDDAIRGDAVDAASAAEKQALVDALKGKVAAIDAWIDGFAEGELSDEAAAFMYLLEAVEEMGLEVR